MSSITTSVSHRGPVDALTKIAQDLLSRPAHVTERTCLLSFPDGSTAIGITGISTFTFHGSGPHQGAVLTKLSFRFVSDISGRPEAEFFALGSFDATYDTVWALVDSKGGNVLFGPTGGMQIRTPNLGIGTYLISQLVRAVRWAAGELDYSRYKVLEMDIPTLTPVGLSKDAHHENLARAATMLRKAGFYVSDAMGRRSVGARNFGEIKERTNSSKVRYISMVDLAVVAAEIMSKKNSGSPAQDLLLAKIQKLNQQIVDLNDAHAAAIDSLTAERDSFEEHILREALIRESDLQAQSEQVFPNPAPDAVSPPNQLSTATTHTKIQFELSPSIMRFLYSALAAAVAWGVIIKVLAAAF
ncbi:hypothetical protein [Pseudomonas syringae]|uniref:hypothetical protein n=1 Tax=Pseudomonas syringae TaxID=317 RepID=UPI001F193B8A|nr:hypothetical protein [Pseudomonas syringae]MCF5371273.1 hypothetical protein [Pseudomonas syringae]